MSKSPSTSMRRVSRFFSLVLSGLLGSAVAQGTPGIDVKALYISADTQTLTLTYGADLGFPLGPRSAQTVLDCKRGGKVSTRGYTDDGNFLDVYADPATSDEDKPGAAALLKSGVVKLGQGKLSYTDEGLSARFFCRNGLVVSDLSSYAVRPGMTMLDSDVGTNVNVRSYASGLPVSVTLPGYAYVRGDDLIGTGDIYLKFRGVSLAKADSLTDVGVDRPFDGDREALFLLDPKRNVLLPIRYGSTESGLQTAIPVKSGKGGTSVTLYYTPDYQGASWQKTVLDLGTYQTWTSRVPKPNLKFGK